MANMQEIARMAGVSLGTVSHVLNNTAKVRDDYS
jgi:DNA-binding LacI/PurR family transcriptional regulator